MCRSFPAFSRTILKGSIFYKAIVSTRNYSFLTPIYYMWYPNGIKVVPDYRL